MLNFMMRDEAPSTMMRDEAPSNMMRDEAPSNAFGYFEVDKSTSMTIIGNTINCLVILI